MRLIWNEASGYDELWVEDWCITDRGLVAARSGLAEPRSLDLDGPCREVDDAARAHARSPRRTRGR